MGANQSSDTNHASDGREIKTSYYELLGIEKTATDDEIKKAYRKKALELHPDRNYGDVERTTALFAEVQAAHEVLSDKHERAWYDAHEGDILGRGAGRTEAHFEHDMRVTTADDITRMLRRFHGAVDYSDSPSGFFSYLRDTFAMLAREEEAAAGWDGTETVDYPSFGHRDDTYEVVVRPFYTVWSGFSTKKNFAWKDLYRYSEAPDRRVRRMMEKENKRFRDEGIREFNDAVRTLVAFVRKRDPRYTPNTQNEEQRAKAQRAAAAAQAARSRAVHRTKMQETIPDWAMKRDEEDEPEEDSEDSEEEHFECVACRKTFKSERQYEAHEKSKKHQKAVQALRKKMQKENRHLNLDEDRDTSGAMTPTSQSTEEDNESFPKSNAGGTTLPFKLPEGANSEDVENMVVDGMSELDLRRSTSSNSDDLVSLAKQAQSPPIMSTNEDSEDQEEDDDYAPRDRVQDRFFDNETVPTSLASRDLESRPPKLPKLGKAAQKRAKRAAKEADADALNNKFPCAVCNATFPTKTRMFQHIQDLGHAALKSEVNIRRSGKKR